MLNKLLSQLVAAMPVDVLAHSVGLMTNQKRKAINFGLKGWDLRTGKLRGHRALGLKRGFPPVPPPPAAPPAPVPPMEAD